MHGCQQNKIQVQLQSKVKLAGSETHLFLQYSWYNLIPDIEKKKAHFSNQEACFAAESLSILHMEMLEAHELCIKSIFLQISNKKWELHRLI